MFACGILIALCAASAATVKMYFLDHQLVPLAPFESPFLDQTRMKEFLLGNCIWTIYATWGAWTIAMYAMTFISFVMNYRTKAELLAEDFKDLDEMWMGKVNVSLEYKHAFLRNICIKRQDMNK